MAAQLNSMLNGKVQCRRMRHTVAEWACELAPHSAKPLLMRGEAMLDQPLMGHDESEAEGVLKQALDFHRQELMGEGVAVSSDKSGVCADAQYWGVYARALQETGMGRRDMEAAAILRDGIEWLPLEVELYLQLGSLLERLDPNEAIELYASFPLPPEGKPPTFDHAVIANSSVRLLMERKEWDNPNLVPHLIVVGKVLGVLNIEKHVQVLDRENQVDVIKEAYMGVMPDFDQSAFFKSKGWIQ